MGEEFQFFDIILFAMVAAFLVLRLRNVLGRRGGHEKPPPDPLARGDMREQLGEKVVHLPDRSGDAGTDGEPLPEEPDSPIAVQLEEILEADPGFDDKEFLSGSRMAFEMIIGAYISGEASVLKPLLSPAVFANFSKAIRDREQAGEIPEESLIGIKNAEIVEVFMEGSFANVTVKFLSEQINATRNADGEIIDGDPNKVIEVTDFWTFARDTRSRDPNWILVATRSLD